MKHLSLCRPGGIHAFLAVLFLFSLATTRAESTSVSGFSFSAADVAGQLVGITCIGAETESTGCGFIASMDGQTYLFTSQHLLLGAEKINFKSPAGKSIKPRSIELCAERDIARLALVDDDGLTIATDPAMGIEIGVFSSTALKPAAALFGSITGVGAQIIEVSADFTDEISGSPVLNSDQQVLGIASYVRESRSHAMKKGTKFENRTRRFCYRLDNTKWESVNWKHYNAKYGTVYRESRELIDDVIEILNTWADAPFDRIAFKDQTDRSLTSWAESHNRVVRGYKKNMNFDRKFFSDFSESAGNLAEVCRSRSRKIRMVAEQRGATDFLLNEYDMQAGTLEYAAKIIEQYSASTDY